jgi:uncharacterized BrkB/YihY/UPF0761 family membrane protein
MGTILLVALVGAVILETFSTSALNWLGLNEEATWLVQLSAVVILGMLVWIVVVALYGAAWWNRPHRRWRSVMVGALYTTVVLVVLTQASFLVVGKTLSNPVYGALAVAAALLVFLYTASAVLLYFASWVALCEGAPRTDEEVAYLERLKGGDVELPSVATVGATSATFAAGSGSSTLQPPPTTDQPDSEGHPEGAAEG